VKKQLLDYLYTAYCFLVIIKESLYFTKYSGSS
jgi:hypothetical protein